MYVALGMYSMKVYATENTKVELMQLLQKKFKLKVVSDGIYPEPILLHKKVGA